MTYSAVVFPGQGAQKIGMGKDFIENHDKSAQVFAKANKLLGFDVYEVCHKGKDLINQTEYTQPCLLVTEIAMFEAMKHDFGLSPIAFAGHSLGEYSALVAADVIPYEVALKMVIKRGQLMNEANTDGAMTAIIMDEIDLQALQQVVAELSVDVANDNSSQQVVISGEAQAVAAATLVLQEKYQDKAFRAVPLNVSAAFHSRWMSPIESCYLDFITSFSDQINEKNLSKVASNYLGGFYPQDRNVLLESLAKQLSGSVKWRDNMSLLSNHKVLELGPNRPLRGFFKTQGQSITSVINVKSAHKAFPNSINQAASAA